MAIIKPVDSLTPGMTVSRDVDVRGTTLLKAGTLISDAHIRQLQKWGVNSISIASPEEDFSTGTAAGQDDARYLREKERIEQLFSTVGADKQMQILKTCLLHHIEGH